MLTYLGASTREHSGNYEQTCIGLHTMGIEMIIEEQYIIGIVLNKCHTQIFYSAVKIILRVAIVAPSGITASSITGEVQNAPAWIKFTA